MSLKLGNQDVTKVMLGSTEVSAVYKGADEVWSAGGGGDDWVFTNLGNEGITASGANLYDVVHNGNVWATTGYVGAFATSEDGINWSSTGVYLLPEEDDPELQRTLGDNNFRGIVWTGLQWVVAGSKGYCTTSQDGVNWTTRTGLAGAVEDNIIYGMATNLNDGEEIIACSANGLAGRSTNGGLGWKKVVLSAAGGNFYAVKHNGSMWCAVGNGCAATSTNGTTWTAKNSGLPNIKAVASNGTVWCGVGLQGLCLTSTDGLNWVQNSGLSDVMTTGFSCRNISGVKDLFVAVGGGGQVATSKDGVTWKKEKSTGTSELYGVLVNDLGTVACSNNSEVAFNPSIKAPPLYAGEGGYRVEAGGGSIKVGTSSDFNPKGDDFALEGWFNFDAVGGTQILFDWRDSLATTNVPTVYLEGNRLSFHFLNGASQPQITHETTPKPRTWHHIAVSVKGSVARLFLDGVRAGQTAVFPDNYAPDDGLQIGSLNGSYAMNGFCEGIRYTAGRRYGTNNNFEPPVVPYPLNQAGDPDYYHLIRTLIQAGDGFPVGGKMSDVVSGKTIRMSGTNGTYQKIPSNYSRRKDAQAKRRESAKEAIVGKAKNSKDIKDDG